MRNEDDGETPVFACCSVGIGRWLWVAWASEDEARAGEKPLASGYEKSAARAEEKATEHLGTEGKRLPGKWASASRGGGASAARSVGPQRGKDDGEGKPRSRLSRPKVPLGRPPAEPRLAFLYAVTPRERPDSLGDVAVTRHRIVKQTAGKIRVERDPFDEDEWARRAEPSAGTPEIGPGPRTVAVDRLLLRKEGRYVAGRSQGGLTFYASEEAGTRDVAAALEAKHAWSDVLGVRFPCSSGDVKAAYRRRAFAAHPDRGGDPAAFRAIEQAYRSALACFATGVALLSLFLD